MMMQRIRAASRDHSYSLKVSCSLVWSWKWRCQQSILTRYNEIGLEGLTDRSRRPYRHANQLPIQIETLIVRLKQDRPSWGAPRSGKG